MFNLQKMKEINKKAILKVIFKRGQISRTTIAEETTLGNSTITKLVKELIEEGFIAEIKLEKSSGGRKAILLDIVPKSLYEVVLNVNSHSAEITIYDFKLEKVCSIIRDFKDNILIGGLFENIVKTIDYALMKHKISVESVIGFSINDLSFLEDHDKLVLIAKNSYEDQMFIIDALEMHYKTSYYISNSINAKAIAKNFFTKMQLNESYILIDIADEVEALLVSEKQEYTKEIYIDEFIENTSLKSFKNEKIDYNLLNYDLGMNCLNRSKHSNNFYLSLLQTIDNLSMLFGVKNIVLMCGISDKKDSDNSIKLLGNLGFKDLNVYALRINSSMVSKSLGNMIRTNYLG